MHNLAEQPHKNIAFARYAWAVLVFNLLVILVGTVVRATGSGAGCGQHWPTCKGEIIPVAPSLHTIIEFTHRVVSGLDGLLVLGLVAGALLLYPRGHQVRRAAPVTLVLTIVEALLGAVLVKRGYVENDASIGRAIAMSVHLCTTFFPCSLLWLSYGLVRQRTPARVRLFAQGSVSGALWTGLCGDAGAGGLREPSRHSETRSFQRVAMTK